MSDLTHIDPDFSTEAIWERLAKSGYVPANRFTASIKTVTK